MRTRTENRPLLSNTNNNISKNTTTSSNSRISLKSWKLWFAIITTVLALALVIYSLTSGSLFNSHQNNKNKSQISRVSIKEKNQVATSTLNDDTIAKVKQDSGLTSDAIDDLIVSLPGLTTDINNLGYQMFSGYINVDSNDLDDVDNDIQKQLFYWFFTADDDEADSLPIMLWTNGGPGCSGMDGLLTEHGALKVDENLELEINDYSWNKYSNMIYVEQPYGVGFSVPGKGQVVGGDTNAATDMDSFLRNFITKYPKYSDNEFFLSSESWGGHYIPLTALTILDNNSQGKTPEINLKGFLLGNPYTEDYENWIGWMEALYGHGLMKQSTYEEWRSECYGNLPDLTDEDCELNYIQSYIEAIGVDWYALDWPSCEITEKYSTLTSDTDGTDIDTKDKDFKDLEAISISNNKFRWAEEVASSRATRLWTKLKENDNLDSLLESKGLNKDSIESSLSQIRGASPEIKYISCGEDYMASWLNLESTQTSLHAKTTYWAMCSDDVYYAWPDTDWINGMQTTYHTLVNNYPDLKMVLYSGDDDSVCGTPGTQYWLRNMGWDVDEDHDWKEWKLDNELAGFYTRFLHESGRTALHFQTVRTAGHMVPTTRPKQALDLMKRFFYYYK